MSAQGNRELKGKALKIVERAVKHVLSTQKEPYKNENFVRFLKETKVCGGKSLQEHLGISLPSEQ